MGVVPRPPRALVSSSRGTTSANQSPVPGGRTWCFTPREPLFLRPGAPRLRTKTRFPAGGRGASPPASPCSFVPGHHVCEPKPGSRRLDVVLHLPRALVPSSRGTTSPRPPEPPACWTWCFILRKPLFLRPGAPRPRDRPRLRHVGRGASPPASPCFFVQGHHVPPVRPTPGRAAGNRAPAPPLPDGIGKGSADEFAIRPHFLPLLYRQKK